MMLITLGFFGATMLPLRFNMFILLPAILLGWTLVMVRGLSAGSSGGSIALELVLVAVVLQVGYLAGIILKWALLASRRRAWADKPAMLRDFTF